jgi:hypothetical protein
MTVTTWDTRQAAPNGFAAAWNERLTHCRLANFSMDLALLEWEAGRGNHAKLALVEEGGRRGALVLRETVRGWESGWPWRWQAALEGGADAPLVPSSEDARWLYAQANALTGGKRLWLHLPLAPGGAAPAFFAGATLVKDMRCSEDDLFKTLDGNKRRATKQALKAGYTVGTATTIEQWRAFAELHRPIEERHGYKPAPLPAAPGPGESYREWELPWMWLLVVEREGRVEGGSGFGRTPSGHLDYRVNASTPEALKAGANALLAWEALRVGRERGHTAMNWGGVTTFKKTLGGDRVESHCWLGGGALWALPNMAVAGVHAARAKAATIAKARAAAAAAKKAL